MRIQRAVSVRSIAVSTLIVTLSFLTVANISCNYTGHETSTIYEKRRPSSDNRIDLQPVITTSPIRFIINPKRTPDTNQQANFSDSSKRKENVDGPMLELNQNINSLRSNQSKEETEGRLSFQLKENSSLAKKNEIFISKANYLKFDINNKIHKQFSQNFSLPESLEKPDVEHIFSKVPKWVGRREQVNQRHENIGDNFYAFSNLPSGVDNRESNENKLTRKDSLLQQKSYIRHRKSRKTFVRTRKSPKIHQHSQSYDYEDVLPKDKDDYMVEEQPLVTVSDSLYDSYESGPSMRSPDLLQGNLAISSQQLDFKDESSETPNDTLSNALSEEQFLADNFGITDFVTELNTEAETVPQNENRDSVDVVTKFLRIIESQQAMGENCTKGTEFSLGEGVVDRYAQERFRLEAEVAVNKANLYTRLWKYTRQQVLVSEYLFHAEVLSLLEFDDDIFAAGACHDHYQYPNYELFCPFAHRLPGGKIRVKDLALEYFYLTNGSEWFLDAKKSAEKVIENFTQFKRGYHSFTWNLSSQPEPLEEVILSVRYEDGIWSKPYFDCGGGNIWMMTYTVPFFGYSDGIYFFKGTSGIDVDLRRVDIDQCPLPLGSAALNVFAASDKCKNRTTKCVSIPGLGFRRGSYMCLCKDGFYYPNTDAEHQYFNGSQVEEEYEKKLLNQPSLYDQQGMFECLACSAGCETCVDGRPCVVSLNWFMRTAVLVMALVLIACLPAIALLTWKYGNVKVVRAASPALLRFIILGASFIYCTSVVQYPIPNVVTCSLRVWLREIGFSLTYGALMLKTWRISVVFRVRSAKAIKITDAALLRRLGLIVAAFSAFLAVRTVVDPPHVVVSYTTDGLKAYLCSTDWWDHVFTAMEMSFLVWGIRLCIVVRKAPSEFNESRFISMAIYNEFLLTLFLNVSMLFLRSPANPDLLFIIYFCHTQLTVTLLIALIFGSKAYMVVKGQCQKDDSISMTKPSAAKLHHKGKNSAGGHASLSSSMGPPLEDVQEEFQRVYLQLEALKERNIRLNNRHLVDRITAMLEAAAAVAVVVTTISDSRSIQEAHNNRKITSTEDSNNLLGIGSNGFREATVTQGTQSSQEDYEYCSKTDQLPMIGSDAVAKILVVGSELSENNPNTECSLVRNAPVDFLCDSKPNNKISTITDYSHRPIRANRSDSDFVDQSIFENSLLRKHSDVTCKNRKFMNRRKGNTEAKLSDGIVMRPIINSICPNALDQIIMTSNSSVGVIKCAPVVVNPVKRESLTMRTGNKDVNIQTSGDTFTVEERSTQTSNIDRFLSCSSTEMITNNIRHHSLIYARRRLSTGSEIDMTTYHSHSSFLLGLNLNCEEQLTNDTIPLRSSCESLRLYHSLENLGDSSCANAEGSFDRDFSSRSAQSTPRQTTRRKFVRDPDRARAFILYNLADRAKFTGEVTV